MIPKEQAIIAAKLKVRHLNYIDPDNVIIAILLTREAALAAGVKDGANIRDAWDISFKRIETGHPLDGIFEFLSVSVDAETAEATIIESL